MPKKAMRPANTKAMAPMMRSRVASAWPAATDWLSGLAVGDDKSEAVGLVVTEGDSDGLALGL